MKPVIIIELDGGTQQIYITKIGLFLVGATTFVAVHFKKIMTNKNRLKKNTPKGIRIPVCSVKGSCPRPLDDGGKMII